MHMVTKENICCSLFLFQLIFIFPMFLGIVMYANEFKTKENQKLTEIKNLLQHIHQQSSELSKNKSISLGP